MKSTNKSILKSGYYWEQNNWYDSCPENLPEAPKFKTVIFPRTITHAEILKEYNITPYNSYAEGASVIASLIPDLKSDYKSRIVYFKENDVLFRFSAWRDGDFRLRLDVSEVSPDSRCSPEYGAAFTATDSEILENKSLDNLDSFSLSSAIKICKDNGLKVYKEC